MKRIIALITAVLLLSLSAAAALAAPKEWQDATLPDFTAVTIDGDVFRLSESLQTHDLVLINLWATWCGPCRNEFPLLEKAWQKYQDRVDVIALSIEPNDTQAVLTRFARNNSLHFGIARDEANIFGLIGGSLIPTTLIVNRDMRVVAVEIGSKTSVKAFTSLFDRLLAAYGQQ